MPSQSITIDDKETIARSIAMNLVVYSQKAELDEIRGGFDCLKFSGLVQSQYVWKTVYSCLQIFIHTAL